MSVDTDANKIAMELHHPFKEVGHIWVLCDFNTGDIFTAWLDIGAGKPFVYRVSHKPLLGGHKDNARFYHFLYIKLKIF